MSVDNYASVWEIDSCFPVPKTKLTNENGERKCSHWTNLKRKYSSEHKSKKGKTNHHLYLLQEIKSKNYLKLNDQ